MSKGGIEKEKRNKTIQFGRRQSLPLEGGGLRKQDGRSFFVGNSLSHLSVTAPPREEPFLPVFEAWEQQKTVKACFDAPRRVTRIIFLFYLQKEICCDIMQKSN